MKQIRLIHTLNYALVDDEDYGRLSFYRWYISRLGRTAYAITTINGKTINMHTFILGARDGLTIDHINGKGLDNQKNNLRYATRSQQNYNQRKTNGNTASKYKCVYWHKVNKRWYSQIKINGKRLHLGYFDSEEDAAKAYNIAAIKYFGEFAVLNFSK